MTKLLLSSLVAASLVVPVTQLADGRRGGDIAYVSTQRILSESNQAKAASARLEAVRQERERVIAEKQKALEATHRRLGEAGGAFQSSKRTQIQADEDRQRAELKRLTDEAQTQLQTLQREIQTDLRNNLRTVLERLAKDRGLRVVLNSDTAVIWSLPGMDLTDEVLAKLNELDASRPKR